ncbi:hypothetical protein ACRALDRAFT_2026980 [Sodiomyces alcalophilus JCM 7366]|uniref:uncharacterized protein n=1 Tax=Sodiomyces alcalophilus JCM 7366 TaxID=591952 RepID=UPI0039B6CB6D
MAANPCFRCRTRIDDNARTKEHQPAIRASRFNRFASRLALLSSLVSSLFEPPDAFNAAFISLLFCLSSFLLLRASFSTLRAALLALLSSFVSVFSPVSCSVVSSVVKGVEFPELPLLSVLSALSSKDDKTVPSRNPPRTKHPPKLHRPPFPISTELILPPVTACTTPIFPSAVVVVLSPWSCSSNALIHHVSLVKCAFCPRPLFPSRRFRRSGFARPIASEVACREWPSPRQPCDVKRACASILFFGPPSYLFQ